MVNSHKKERTAANDPSILGSRSLNGHSMTPLPVLLALEHSNFRPHDSSGCRIDSEWEG